MTDDAVIPPFDALPRLPGNGVRHAWDVWDSGVAAVACDNPAAEVVPSDPSDGFLHGRLITGLGMAIGEFFTDDSVWQVNDVARGLPAQRGRKGIIDDFLQPIREGLFERGDPKVEIRRLIAEDDWVVAETTARGTLLNGSSYQNEYVFVIQVDGDTVRFLREYMDSDYAHSVSAGAGGAGGADGHVSETLKRLGHD